MQRRFAGMIGLFLFAALMTAPVATAQDQDPPAAQDDAPAPAVVDNDFSAEELDAFAEAYVDVEEVQARYLAEHAEIEDPEEAVRIQSEFEQEVAGAVEARGLNAESYDAIVRTSQTDEEFAQALLARIAEARERRAQD